MHTNAETASSAMVETAHTSFVATARCARNMTDATLDTVADLGSRKDNAAALDSPEDWSFIARGIIRGAIDIGADLESVGQGMMLGVIRSAKSERLDQTQAIKIIAQIGIHETIAFGGDIEAMANGLAAGATEGSREAGAAEESFIFAAAEGAKEGFGDKRLVLCGLMERAAKRAPAPSQYRCVDRQHAPLKVH